MELFKIRPHASNKIMGRVGITEIQETALQDLQNRKDKAGSVGEDGKIIKPLTAKMEQDLSELLAKKADISISTTAKTHCQEWYANEPEELYNKEIAKGKVMESPCIEFASKMLYKIVPEMFLIEKNETTFENEYIKGTPDVVTANFVLDTKCPFNKKTFAVKAMQGVVDEYFWQLQCYMHLTGRKKAILFYGLMNTPAYLTSNNIEVDYSSIPENERFAAFMVEYDAVAMQELENRVILCRKYLENYENLLNQNLGINF